MFQSVSVLERGTHPAVFESGDEIPYSGVYRVTHQNHHHVHEVTCLTGGRFPTCNTCGSAVRFLLIRAARSLRKHPLFSDDE